LLSPHPGLLFQIIIAHGGVRPGRKVYLLDMANSETRSAHVAQATRSLGIIMLIAGHIGWIAARYGVADIILLLSLIAAAAIYALRIRDVSDWRMIDSRVSGRFGIALDRVADWLPPGCATSSNT